ncbi:MAG: carbon-nitrogen hydrolase family protein [Rhodothermaceae bacterium]|nr:carbon-nitrogen hydrolase family protein [Rhodothermaceae bacterium]MYD20299.1 carbon-nitrogen hydrolase family protein [Rhodothermaceae bacterium]MYI42537.1 carbon-nitrogen hydrolase family protein [Rhodothermaceae bacterium]
MKVVARDLTVALISEIFSSERELVDCLEHAHDQDAALAILPELPFNLWSPATKAVCAEDAEGPGGLRENMLCAAAKKAGIAVLGGVIRRDSGGLRTNLALLSDSHGCIIGSSAKHVLPDEEGFWECDHYRPSEDPPRIIEFTGIKLGVQICSDANRPTAAQLLAAQGVQVILAPRATSPSSWKRWRLAYQAMALTCSAWVVSVGRPRPEFGVDMGGPSLVVNPMGEVLLETTDRIAVTTLNLSAVEDARQSYPGYLVWAAKMYVAGWAEVHENHIQQRVT